MKNFLRGLLIFTLAFGLISCSPQETSLDGLREKEIKENVKKWFDGEELDSYKGSNRDYDWYIDQMHTGQYSNNNCGPSSAVMAMKWLDPDFEGTAAEARDEHPLNGGWWYTSIITQYFQDRDVKPNYLLLQDADVKESVDDLKEAIDEDKIALICINMDDISYEAGTDKHINRFYEYGDGHFLLIKGYAQVDGKDYFEVYDPNSWGKVYDDGSPMGKDRFYKADEIVKAAVDWYEFAIVINPPEDLLED